MPRTKTTSKTSKKESRKEKNKINKKQNRSRPMGNGKKRRPYLFEVTRGEISFVKQALGSMCFWHQHMLAFDWYALTKPIKTALRSQGLCYIFYITYTYIYIYYMCSQKLTIHLNPLFFIYIMTLHSLTVGPLVDILP